MHVTVPEAGGDDHAFAVDDRDGACEARRMRRSAGADATDNAVMDEDGGIFDGRSGWRGIDFCMDEGEVGSRSVAWKSDDEDHAKQESLDSH